MRGKNRTARITPERVREIALMIQRHHFEAVGSERYIGHLKEVAADLGLADKEMVRFLAFVLASRNRNGKSVHVYR